MLAICRSLCSKPKLDPIQLCACCASAGIKARHNVVNGVRVSVNVYDDVAHVASVWPGYVERVENFAYGLYIDFRYQEFARRFLLRQV